LIFAGASAAFGGNSIYTPIYYTFMGLQFLGCTQLNVWQLLMVVIGLLHEIIGCPPLFGIMF